jgi:hypothetical protein
MRERDVNTKASNTRERSNKCTVFPLGSIPGDLFTGVVRGSGNNVRTAPLTTLV